MQTRIKELLGSFLRNILKKKNPDEFLEQSNKKATDIRNSLEGLKNGK